MGRHRIWAEKLTIWEWRRMKKDLQDFEARAVRAETELAEIKKVCQMAWQMLTRLNQPTPKVNEAESPPKMHEPLQFVDEPLQFVQKIQKAGG
jgi:hypothetical protein